MASGYGTIRERQLTFKNSYMECSVSSGYRLTNETKCKKLEKKLSLSVMNTNTMALLQSKLLRINSSIWVTAHLPLP